MSELSKMNIVEEESGKSHNFSVEIQSQILQHVADEYQDSLKLKIVSENEAELYVTKDILFTNANGYNIEPETPEFKFKNTPTYFITITSSYVEAKINPKYKSGITADFSSLKLEYAGAKAVPFLLGKLLNDGFKFSTEKSEVNGFVVENVSTKHSISVCEPFTKLINPNHKDNLYFRLEDDFVFVIAKKALKTLKTQFSNSPYEKMFYFTLDENGESFVNTPVFSKNKEFYSELEIPMFVYSKSKPQILSQIEFMLKVLYGENFTLELNYDEDKKADIAIIKLTNAVYKLEINNLAHVYKNNKLLNIAEKADPYNLLMKEMIKPYLDHMAIKNWSTDDYEQYAQLVHQGLFY
jgi:hypothetical protein